MLPMLPSAFGQTAGLQALQMPQLKLATHEPDEAHQLIAMTNHGQAVDPIFVDVNPRALQQLHV